MKIAQVAPLYESVPPHRYGGTERVVSILTEELVRQGHEVTLFASGDSRTRAKLVAGCPRALRRAEGCAGRTSPVERVDRSTRIDERVGMKLKIAAKVHEADRDYYEQRVKPLLKMSRSLVEFVGEISDEGKDEFLGNAYAMLFPIDWPEPFGLVMIEAMACGTPVIAYRNGSVPEIMEDGVTGFVVDSTEQAVEAIERVADLPRLECRRTFERRFTDRRMAEDYVAVYRQLVEQGDYRPNG